MSDPHKHPRRKLFGKKFSGKSKNRPQPEVRKQAKIIEVEVEPEAIASYCKLPSWFFDAAHRNRREDGARTLLSVMSWDGREIMHVESKY